MSYKLIADACKISIDTVRGNIRRIYEKLHAHSKSEAVAMALKGKIVIKHHNKKTLAELSVIRN